VVHVRVKKKAPRRGQSSREYEGSGSGVIITPDGYIVTNSHVVEDASGVEATLADGTTGDAEVVGQDTATDIALRRISGSGLPMAYLGDSDKLKEGDIVVSLGDEPVTSVDDIHRRLSREAIGKRLNVVLLRDWTRRMEMSVVPAENPAR
jgi:S1-C subfamily serine protease